MIDVADNNAIYYYHFDGLGSVVALSDSSANIVEQYSYDVFGEPDTTSSIGNPYLFTGRRHDDETGLYYYRARYYAPDIGRFMSPDPVTMYLQLLTGETNSSTKYPGKYVSYSAIQKFLQSSPVGRWLASTSGGRLLTACHYGIFLDMNLYSYCGNNPLVRIDPYGLGFWKDLWAAKGVIGVGLTLIGGGLILAATSPAWITAGAIIAGVGIALVALDTRDQGKWTEHPPGEKAFRDYTDRIEKEMSDDKGCDP